MHSSIKAGDLLAQRQVVECEVLSKAELVHAIHADGIIDHVRHSIPLRWHEYMHPKPKFGVHPCTHMRLDTLDPTRIPGCKHILALCHSKRLLDLANRVRLANVDGSVPLLIGVTEYMPVRRLHLRPRLAKPCNPIGKGIKPALQEISFGIGLNVDRHVFVDAVLASLGGEIVKRAAIRSRELGRARVRVRYVDRWPCGWVCYSGWVCHRCLSSISSWVPTRGTPTELGTHQGTPTMSYSTLPVEVNLSKKMRSSLMPLRTSTGIAASIMGGGPQ